MEYQHSRLANGLQVISGYHPNAPLATILLHVAAGSRYEQPDEFGYAHFAEHVTFDGTEKFPSRELLGMEIDRLGAYANAFTSKEFICWQMQVPSTLINDGGDLLAEIVQRSLYSDESIEHEKSIIQQEIARAEDDPMRVLIQRVFERLFNNHPLGHKVLGDTTVVAAAITKAVHGYYQRYVIPSRSVLTIVGPLSHQQVVELAERYFGPWKNNDENLPIVRTAVIPVPPTEVHIPFITQRSCFSLSYLLPSATAQEQSAGEVLAAFVARGRSSVFFRELRSKLALTYDVFGGYSSFLDAGVLEMVASSTKPLEFKAAIKATSARLLNLFTLEEFIRTRQQLQNKFWQQVYSTPIREADFLGQEALLTQGLTTPIDRQKALAAVTYDEVRAAMEKYLAPEKGYLTIVGPEPVELITN